MTMIKLTIPGRVVSHKNNYTIVRKGQRPSLARNAKLNDCRTRIKIAAYESGYITPDYFKDDLLSMKLTIYTTKPYSDIDGIATTIFDALEGILYENDASIWEVSQRRVHVAKRKDERVVVELSEVA